MTKKAQTVPFTEQAGDTAQHSSGAGVGRPTAYSDAVAEAICVSLMCGHSLARICSLEGMPAQSTVYTWLAQKDHPFIDRYVRAREVQAEVGFDELRDISDDKSDDVSGELKMPNSVAVQRARLQIDTRKWIASKMLPKKYGDKLDHRVETVSLNALFDRMSAAELERYAASGELPTWFQSTVGSPSSDGRERLQ